jgi:hypothetical protein
MDGWINGEEHIMEYAYLLIFHCVSFDIMSVCRALPNER